MKCLLDRRPVVTAGGRYYCTAKFSYDGTYVILTLKLNPDDFGFESG